MATASTSKQSSQGQTSASGNGYTDFTRFGEQAFKSFQNLQVPGVNPEQMMASHRRNMETMAELQKAAMDTARALGRLQSQYMRQSMEDMAAFSRNVMQAGPSLEDQVEAQAGSMKQAMHRASEQGKELNDLLNKTQQKVSDLCNSRLDQCMDECKTMVKSTTPGAKK